MTLFINELSFDNFQLAASPETISVQTTPLHSSNYPDIQTIGVSDTALELTILYNKSDVEEVVERLRGSIRNREFTIIRSTDQTLRDNKKTIFVKVTSLNPMRRPGTVHFVEIKLNCKYVGTLGSHQPNYFINSVQVNNDWSKQGTTMVALPVGAYAVNQSIATGLASHDIIRSPTWSTGTEAATYADNSTARGTIGFNIAPSTVFDKVVRIYNGSYQSGKHVTDTDFVFDSGYCTIRQDGYAEVEIIETSNLMTVRKYNAGTSGYDNVIKVILNSGASITNTYLLSINDHYVRVGLSSEEEVEFYSCKMPALFVGKKAPKISGSLIASGNVSGGSYNFLEVQSGAFVAGNRYFNVSTSGYLTALDSTKTDVMFWFGWEAVGATSGFNIKALDVLRRLE